MNRTKPTVILLLVALVAACVAASCREIFFKQTADETYAQSVYDAVTPELIEIYEREVAGEEIVSSMSEAQIARTAKRMNAEPSKIRVLYIVQDISARVGKPISLDELNDMSDIALIVYAKKCGEDYANTLSPDRREQLKRIFLEALKK